MSSTDTTTAATETEFQKFESFVSAEWTAFLAFIKQEESKIGSFLSAFSAGEPIFIADVQAVAGAVAGKASLINAAAVAIGSAVTTVDPNAAAPVQKLLGDVNAGLVDAAAITNALQSGASANDPDIVNKAVSVIGSVNTLAQLAGVAGAALTQAVQNSPTATTAVTPGTPVTPAT